MDRPTTSIPVNVAEIERRVVDVYETGTLIVPEYTRVVVPDECEIEAVPVQDHDPPTLNEFVVSVSE
ncbi:hypothetical protein [Bowdeniella massiliensis]|uniref:hypothetical protein n=1 Tax=Bowdeniella massiliensis TaxID=2932264 RepID=UPI002028B8D0|nr:hypothetical protein [Bowdeniella massiliensis]